MMLVGKSVAERGASEEFAQQRGGGHLARSDRAEVGEEAGEAVGHGIFRHVVGDAVEQRLGIFLHH